MEAIYSIYVLNPIQLFVNFILFFDILHVQIFIQQNSLVAIKIL